MYMSNLPAKIYETNVPDLSEWGTIELVPIKVTFDVSYEQHLLLLEMFDIDDLDFDRQRDLSL